MYKECGIEGIRRDGGPLGQRPAGLAARRPIEIDGMEAADVSFPGFVPTLVGLGASIEVVSG